MGKILTTLTLEHRDSKKLLEIRTQPSRSWTLHMLQLMYLYSGYNSNTVTTNDISNTSRNLAAPGSNQFASTLQVASPPGGAGVNVATGGQYRNTLSLGENLGIVIGTGNTPVNPIDYALITKVGHGEGVGQLLYGGTEIYGMTFANPNGQFNIRRYFTNVNGGSITIQEVGIYAYGDVGDSTWYSFCICRDIVSPGVVISNGQILSVVYTVQITV